MRLMNDWLIPLVLVTATYLIAFYLTFFVFFPMQEAAFGTISLYANLLFLPHGIRMLTALFYSWRSIIFLTPGTLLTHYYLTGWEGFEFPAMFGAIVSIVCASASYEVLKWLKMDARNDDRYKFNWRYLLLAGIAASIINSFGTNFAYHVTPTYDMFRGIIAYIVGDVSGQLFLMLILMLIFRWMRLTSKNGAGTN